MVVDYEKSAQSFLELASEQRLAILDNLRENESKLSVLTKLLDSTCVCMCVCTLMGS